MYDLYTEVERMKSKHRVLVPTEKIGYYSVPLKGGHIYGVVSLPSNGHGVQYNDTNGDSVTSESMSMEEMEVLFSPFNCNAGERLDEIVTPEDLVDRKQLWTAPTDTCVLIHKPEEMKLSYVIVDVENNRLAYNGYIYKLNLPEWEMVINNLRGGK